MSEHHKGPVAWQKFGKEYCLTAQYGMRPIILSVGNGKLMLRDQATDRLIPLSPEHPDAKFIVDAYNLHDRLVKALEKAAAILKKIQATDDESIDNLARSFGQQFREVGPELQQQMNEIQEARLQCEAILNTTAKELLKGDGKTQD